MPRLNAQSFGPYFDPSVAVADSTGNELLNPWSGGLNACQFSRIDADLDGNKDLFVFDRSGDKIELFLYRVEQGNQVWKHHEAYDSAFPYLTDWVLCRDFDRDGDRDLFTSNSGGIALYENTTNGSGPLEFELLSDQLLSDHYPADTSTGPINIYVQNADVPAIDDIDGDGDLDILSFRILGSQVEYHKNMALEQTGKTDTIIFDRKNACWGYFSEDGSGNIILNDSCSGNVQNPESGGAHSGSTLLTLNMNGDSTKELVLGDLGNNRLRLLRNGGGPFSALIDQVTDPFPTQDPLELESFPASFYTEVNHDGIRDLLVSPNKVVGSNDQKSIWFYRNEGSNKTPSFDLVQRDFLQEGMIDLGKGAFPVFVDIDKDGDQDLFVGNHKRVTQSGEKPSSIAYFENTGSSSTPYFHLREKDYQNLSQTGMGQALHPSFGDLDGDGDLDLLIGDSDGYIHYFENSSPVGNAPDYSLAQPQYKDSSGTTIDIGQFAAPRLIDLDRDSLLDLVLGEKGGNLVHYENIGTSSSPSFAHRNDSLGDVLVTAPGGFEGYSVPRFFEDSGTYELIVGSKNGKLHYYKGIEKNLNGKFQAVTHFFGGLDEGLRSAPALADLNGDQRTDMILGNYGGGIAYYRGGDTVNSSVVEKEGNKELRLWPNPASPHSTLQIETKMEFSSAPDPIIYNVQGQRIPVESRKRGAYRLSIELPGLKPGLYFLRIERSKKAHAFIVR